MPHSDVLVIGAPDVEAALSGREHLVLDTVQKAYETHARGDSSLPHSSFLRFPDSDADRIICLPAYLGGDYRLAGVKWIASVPGNVSRGIERASAVVILNDRQTGRPTAILEGSIISKQRTAASAALAARVLAPSHPRSIGFIGCGPINAAIAAFLRAVWPEISRFVAFDLDPQRAKVFGRALLAGHRGLEFRVAPSLEELLRDCPVVSFATTAITPYLGDLDACQEAATVLHVSLRDLHPDAILGGHNVVDDLDHVCRAGTSIFLTAEKTGSRDFVHASLGEILTGSAKLPPRDGRPVIFSPFGLGILDLAVADLVKTQIAADGGGSVMKSFLP